MRATRSVLCLALASTVAVVGSAGAATKPKPRPLPPPVCNLITDDAGDAAFVGAGEPGSDALDIVSADIATGAKNVTAVIRVRNLAKDNYTQLGKEFKFVFAVNGSFEYLRVQTDPTGDSFDYGTMPSATGSSTREGAAAGSYDPATNTVTMTIDKASVGIKKGAKITNLTARSYVYAGAVYEPDDEATTTKTYVEGTRSCVRTS